MERPRAREVALAQLEEPLRRGEILEAVLSEGADVEALVEQVPRRLTEEDLAAVGRRHYPRRPVHIQSHILRRLDDRLAGVDTGPDPDRTSVQCPQRLADRSRRLGA
jgi:hypothetical protein